jgi:ribosomal protein L4
VRDFWCSGDSMIISTENESKVMKLRGRKIKKETVTTVKSRISEVATVTAVLMIATAPTSPIKLRIQDSEDLAQAPISG